MLRLGGVKTLILTGFAADNCALFTAADALHAGLSPRRAAGLYRLEDAGRPFAMPFEP